MISWEMLSPIPDPSCFVVKKGTKILSCSPGVDVMKDE